MGAFSWTTDEMEAARDQAGLREIVKIEPMNLPINVRGLAIGTAYDESDQIAVAVGIPFKPMGQYENREIVETERVEFPYVPGLLVYRVGPAICKLLDRWTDRVDVLMFDGQGIAHPRSIGLASHIGVLYNKPSVGITKNNLFGRCIEPPRARFSHTDIRHPKSGELIGYAVSLGEKCSPIYLSPGHRCDVQSAFEFIKTVSGPASCVPLSVRRAHSAANRVARTRPWRDQQ